MTIIEAILTFSGAILSLALLIIGYFLKRTMTQLDNNIKDLETTKLNLAVLQNDHANKHTSLTNQMASLTEAVRENTKELKDFKEIVFNKLTQ